MRAPLLRPRLRTYGFVALVLALAADGLFFDTPGPSVGLSVPAFIVLTTCGSLLFRPRLVDRAFRLHLLLLTLALLALVETVDDTSLIMAVACLGALVLQASGRLPSGLCALPALASFLVRAPVALYQDNRRRRTAASGLARRRPGSRPRSGDWLIWTMPVVLACGFALLLGAGNPILEQWLAWLDPRLLLERLDPVRILFWALVIGLVWPFLRPRLRLRLRRRAERTPAWTRPGTDSETPVIPEFVTSLICGPAAILRALVLFNGVFAVQTLLDATYLWGGVELPQGIGYAAYAHRGAYTLVATALLAAAFVLVALRPGTEAAADRRIRALVYLWIGQNVVLVLSSMLRLDLYVDRYALTHWRLAAFVWMGIVAAGLVLICLRIAGARSDRWLIGANLLVLALAFAGSCFVDDNALIARFNVAHSREVSGEGLPLDIPHLASLGPAAIPSIDRLLDHGAAAPMEFGGARLRALGELRDGLALDHRALSHDWRDWTFRKWRLTRYLDTHAAPVPVLPAEPALPLADGPYR